MGNETSKKTEVNFSLNSSTTSNQLNISNNNSSHEITKVDERRAKDKNIKRTNPANASASVNAEASILKLIKKHNKDAEDKDLVDGCLQNHFFMRILEKNARLEIIKEMSLYSLEAGIVLFEQGQDGNFFYIIKEGEISVHINKKKIRIMKAGQGFGELAMLHSAPRSATIISETHLKVWAMERRNFRKIIDHINHLNHVEIKKYLSSVPLLSKVHIITF